MVNRASTAARRVVPGEKFHPGLRIVEGEGSSGGFQNRISTKAGIAKFQGQTTEFQSCPRGPTQSMMKACIERAPITAGFRKQRVRSPTSMAASIAGTA